MIFTIKYVIFTTKYEYYKCLIFDLIFVDVSQSSRTRADVRLCGGATAQRAKDAGEAELHRDRHRPGRFEPSKSSNSTAEYSRWFVFQQSSRLNERDREQE